MKVVRFSAAFTPQEIFLVLISVGDWANPRAIVRAGRIMSMKNSSDTIGSRTHDLPVCRAVPQPTAPPRASTLLLCFILSYLREVLLNPLNTELNSICYLLALLGAHHFLQVSSIRVKLLTFRLLMSYIYGAPILDVSRSHTTTQHSR